MIPASPVSSRRDLRGYGVATAAYAALTIAYTWPLVLHLGRGVPHDPGDPLLNTWILWWSTQAVPLTDRWWNAPAFFPAPGILAFSEHLLGLAPIAVPLTALTHLPLLGYNVAFLATFVLSALGAHFLGFTLTKRHDAAFIAGIAFAFAPYRLGQASHIQVLASYWSPICLAALHRYGGTSYARWAALAVIAWLMQALSCGYFLFFLSVLLALWVLYFAIGRWTLRQFAVLAGMFGAAALVLLPFLLGYQRILQGIYGFTRSLHEIRLFSADVMGLLLAPDELLVWGWVHAVNRAESALFPGLAIVLLAALAIIQSRPFAVAGEEHATVRRVRQALLVAFAVLSAAAAIPLVKGPFVLNVAGVRLLSISQAEKPLSLAVIAALALLALLPRVRQALARRSTLAFYLIAAFAMWVLALGPDPTFFDRPVIYKAPYGHLMNLPGFDGLRVPARFWMMALVCLSVVGAIAVNKLKLRRRTIVVAAAFGLLLDGWPGGFPVVEAPPLRPSPPGVVARLDLPMSGDTDAQALYQQMFDPIPLYNGFSGYFAPHYFALRTLVESGDLRILHVLAANGPLGVVIDHSRDPQGTLRKWVLSYPGAATSHVDEAWSSYRLPKSPSPPNVADGAGRPLAIKSMSTIPSPPHAARALDGNLTTRWSGGVQQVFAEATIELEQASHVGQVVIDLGSFITDFPIRLQIDVSADGASWSTAWSGATALEAYFGAIRHPRDMPLVFPLDRDGVRFIRLRQTGFGSHDWSIPELHVLGSAAVTDKAR
jgi:hypothetical protein